MTGGIKVEKKKRQALHFSDEEEDDDDGDQAGMFITLNTLILAGKKFHTFKVYQVNLLYLL